jgi:hypothetical protein
MKNIAEVLSKAMMLVPSGEVYTSEEKSPVGRPSMKIATVL